MNSQSEFLSRIASHFRQFGLLSGLKLLLLTRLRNLFYSERFLFLELHPADLHPADLPPAGSPEDGVIIRALAADEIQACIAAIGRVQRENETVFVAERDGELLGYARTQLGGAYSFGKGAEVVLPPDILMLKGLHVARAARGRRIGRFLNQARVSATHTTGKKVFVSAMSENRPALKNLWRSGFQDVAELSRITVLGKPVSRQVRPCGSQARVPQWLKDFAR